MDLSARTLALRIATCAAANSIHGPPSVDVVLAHEQSLTAALASLPAWADPRTLQARVQLDCQLRQFLAILHAPSSDQHSTRYAKFACTDAAVSLIDQHAALLEAGNSTLFLIHLDFFRAGLYLAQIAYRLSFTEGVFCSPAPKRCYDLT